MNTNMYLYGISPSVRNYFATMNGWKNILHKVSAFLVSDMVEDSGEVPFFVKTIHIDILPLLLCVTSMMQGGRPSESLIESYSCVALIDYLVFTEQYPPLSFGGRTYGEVFRVGVMNTMSILSMPYSFHLYPVNVVDESLTAMYGYTSISIISEHRRVDKPPIIWLLVFRSILNNLAVEPVNLVTAHIIYRLGVGLSRHMSSEKSDLVFRPTLLHNIGAVPLELLNAGLAVRLANMNPGPTTNVFRFYVAMIARPMLHTGRLKTRFSVDHTLSFERWWQEGMYVSIYNQTGISAMSILQSSGDYF